MSLAKNKKIKVCYVLAYKDPDYVRTQVLCNSLKLIPTVELLTAINKSKGLRRYFQTLGKLLKCRIQKNPDVYILGFRGQEIFWPVRFLTIGKPLIFDEFINMHDWLGKEHSKLPKFIIWVADIYEKMAIKCSHLVLTDTRLGAKKSAEVYKQPATKFQHIYVGTNETLFEPRQQNKKAGAELKVLFYGNLLPLHGLPNILGAASKLKDNPIHFTVIGGKGRPKMIDYIESYIEQNKLKNIDYKHWVDYQDLPVVMAEYDVFLGGPFGDTSQSQRVITGKTFQSLSMGITTVIGSINEDTGFVDKQNCLIVDQGSAESIARVLTWALAHKQALPKIGQAGHELFVKRFSSKNIAKIFEGIFESL